MIEKEKIPQQVRDVIFGYGPQFLVECMYVWEREEYKKAVQIEHTRPEDSPEKARDFDNVQYFGKRADILHKTWVALDDNENAHPWTL